MKPGSRARKAERVWGERDRPVVTAAFPSMSAPEITATSAAVPSTNPRNDRPVTFPAELQLPLRRHFTDGSATRLWLLVVTHGIALESAARWRRVET